MEKKSKLYLIVGPGEHAPFIVCISPEELRRKKKKPGSFAGRSGGSARLPGGYAIIAIRRRPPPS